MFTVKHEVSEEFNFVTYKEECEKLGFSLTSAAKDGTEEKFKPLVELEFLKRNFKKLDGKYYGALVEASIGKMLAYCKKTHPHIYFSGSKPEYDPGTIGDTVRGALRECVLHGKEFYNEVRQHLLTRCKQYKIRAQFPSYWDQVDELLYTTQLKPRSLD